MGRTRGGSGAKNGRDANPKNLGIKKYAGEFVTAGSIILKQRGTKFYPGDNVKIAGDDSLFAIADGNVVYGERNNHKVVSVKPVEEKKAAKPAKKATAKAAEAKKVAE